MKRKRKYKLSSEHISRLLIIAECFEKEDLCKDLPEDFKLKQELSFDLIDTRVYFHSFAYTYSELPRLFPLQGAYLEGGFVYYSANPELSTQQAFQNFTGLSTRQFIHCFVPSWRNNMHFMDYGGKPLNPNSRSRDCAVNIYSMLSNILPWSKRMVLIEKI